MAALPYIQLYVADYLADTMHLQAEEHGAYLMLIFNYWQTGKPIPKNRLQSISRVSNDRWSFVEASLKEFFNDTGTHWQHSRIDADLAMVDEAQQQRSAAGKASVEAKRRAKQADIKRKSNDRSTTVEVSLQRDANESDTDTDTDIKKNIVPSVLVIADGESPPQLTKNAGDTRAARAEKRVPFQDIIDVYHEVLPCLPECKKITTKRQGHIRQRWLSGDLPDLQTWRDYFNYVKKSDFLCGRAPPSDGYPKPFRADIDFLSNESNYAKIYEGKYHGRPVQQVQPAAVGGGKLSTVQRASIIAKRSIDAYEAELSAAGSGAGGAQTLEVDGGIARRSLG